MVTSTKAADDKVVAMSVDAGVDGGARPRTLLEDVNTHLTCELCRGYYIDATTIVECLHSFCRSCIVKHLQTKKYCPVCGMMINAAKPNIKPDKALQDIVYKLVPGLFQREMERRRQFYSSRPGPAASTTPEQRGEDTERIIFSPEDVISFSLEYAEVTDAESVSSRSSESGNETPSASQQTRRYLQCPAVVNISHLKKFISMKFDIDCTQFCIDILYKRVPLLDYYTLMDIAYIYNWKRNEPMRFFYQIIDYSAIRSRFGLFDMNRKGSNFRDKRSPTSTEDTNIGSPAPHNDHNSEGTSGTNSPMPDDCNNYTSSKCNQDRSGRMEKNIFQSKFNANAGNNSSKTDTSSALTQEVDVEKSQFLNSFELTPKSSSPSKCEGELPETGEEKACKDTIKNPKIDISSPQKLDDSVSKRKMCYSPENIDDSKKQKLDQTSSYIENIPKSSANQVQSKLLKKNDEIIKKLSALPPKATNSPSAQTHKPIIPMHKPAMPNNLDQIKEPVKSSGQSEHPLKRTYPSSQNATSPKRRSPSATVAPAPQSSTSQSSPMKSSVQSEGKLVPQKSNEPAKTNLKKLPDLKPNLPNPGFNKNKSLPTINRGIRTDLLANNSDPISDPDRSKILSQAKRSLTLQSPSEKNQMSGDPLKSLFDSCKINIPSSLSITLTDQKLDPRGDCNNGNDANKSSNKNSPHNGSGSFNSMKSPTPAVQNSIEILKLPDVDSTKVARAEIVNTAPTSQPTKAQDSPTPTTAKGPVPSLKPISDTKIGKQSTYSKPSPTFHQIFIQSLQTQQPDKTKAQKTKAPVPKLMPANPKQNSETPRNETPQLNLKNQPENKNVAPVKSDSVLDLSTPSQLGPHQTKLLETMQSIANLAKKQNFSPKPTNTPTSIASFPHSVNKPISSAPAPLRIPSQSIQSKPKTGSPISPSVSTIGLSNFQSSKPLFRPSLNSSPNSASVCNTPCQPGSPAQSSPKAQTRSPSVSPKLVIAEEKQTQSDGNQSNQISSSQISSTNMSKIDSGSQPPVGQPKSAKIIKQPLQSTKLTNIRMPGSSGKTASSSHAAVSGADMLQLHSLAPQILAQQQALQQALQARQHNVMQSIGHILPSPADWINKFNQARHIENLYKTLSNAQQAQNDYNGKDNNKK